jgi:N-acetylglutamate synthase-like GNAT family acetyltransferase
MGVNEQPADLLITPLDASQGNDPDLVARLVTLVNGVYRTAESGLWKDGATRTTEPELAQLIQAGQITVAIRDGHIVGCVQIHDVAYDTSEFGMLAADPDHRGIGVGRALVDLAERRSRERDLRAIRLELLVPRTWRHPNKEFLKAWYGRRGYRPVKTTSVAQSHPHLAPLLATQCSLTIYEKPLQPINVRSRVGATW